MKINMVMTYMMKSISPSDYVLFIMLRMPLRANIRLFERSYVSSWVIINRGGVYVRKGFVTYD